MYKATTLFILSLICSSLVYAQPRELGRPEAFLPGRDLGSNQANRADTVALSNLDPDDNLTFYSFTQAPGFTSGHNGYGDLAWAERYSLQGEGEVIACFAYVIGFVATPADTAQLQVIAPFGTDPSNKPGEVLNTSKLPYSELYVDSTNRDALFFMPQETPVSGDFFVSFELAPYDPGNHADTLVLILGEDGVRPPEDTVICRNAVKWEDGSWHDEFKDNVGLLTHYALYPVVIINQATSIDGYVAKNGLRLFASYPNPARSSAYLRFELDRPGPVAVTLHDMQGRRLMNVPEERFMAGEHTIEVDVSSLPAGTYFYSIRTDRAVLASRLIVE